ncbi:MAG: Type 1 glutamine amidotransferase-like domain-containing protein [Candidatus Peribacteraceae bacterium]|nr:Type 1 glutamine amidotransferase-like domain-containing protein [Candidatus Peribacteraceae bacterium]
MKFYLSSYKIGNQPDRLMAMIPRNNKRTAYISNAMDVTSNVQARGVREREDMSDLRNLGLEVEKIDLRDYFGKAVDLESALSPFGVLWVCGGNTFVLRQAMRLSGFDVIIHRFRDKDLLYGGYSAGICVLAPTLKGLHLVDNPNLKPYGEELETIWEGLNLINFSIAPHFQSDHPESEDVTKEVDFCKAHNIPCKPLRDGEVIVIE